MPDLALRRAWANDRREQRCWHVLHGSCRRMSHSEANASIIAGCNTAIPNGRSALRMVLCWALFSGERRAAQTGVEAAAVCAMVCAGCSIVWQLVLHVPFVRSRCCACRCVLLLVCCVRSPEASPLSSTVSEVTVVPRSTGRHARGNTALQHDAVYDGELRPGVGALHSALLDVTQPLFCEPSATVHKDAVSNLAAGSAP